MATRSFFRKCVSRHDLIEVECPRHNKVAPCESRQLSEALERIFGKKRPKCVAFTLNHVDDKASAKTWTHCIASIPVAALLARFSCIHQRTKAVNRSGHGGILTVDALPDNLAGVEPVGTGQIFPIASLLVAKTHPVFVSPHFSHSEKSAPVAAIRRLLAGPRTGLPARPPRRRMAAGKPPGRSGQC
jgi:hypothetical protein